MSRKEMQDAKALIESELSPEDKEKIRPQLDQVEARFDQYELKTHRKY